MEVYLGLVMLIAFPILGMMVFIWFYQISKLFSYLKESYPAEYKSIGEPSLIMNNNLRNNIAFLRFIQGSRPSELGDKKLVTWCKLLTKLLYAYMLIFMGLIVVFMVTLGAS